MNLIEIIHEYEEEVKKLPEAIEKSGYKKDYLMKRLKMPNATFYKKMRNNSFSTQELKNLSEILFPEEYKKHMFMRVLNAGLKDIEEGRVIPYDKFTKDIEQEFSINV